MKKLIAWSLSLMLALTAAGAWAEPADSLFDTLSGLAWSFCSGVGAWSTDMTIAPDGTFTGDFHDSEMGDAAEAYPDGTVYYCVFSGKLSLVERLDEYSWKIRVDELTVEESEGEVIEDGIRFVAAEPYGLTAGDEMLLYRPGTPVSALTEEMVFWAHALEMERQGEDLETWFLGSQQNDSGFVGYEATEGEYLPNPWADLTREGLEEASGLAFGLPEGAENVIYRFLPSAGLAEMQFTLDGDEYCARIQSADLKAGELLDISGMYYDWINQEAVTIGYCEGTVAMAQDGDAWVELCLWYDLAPGLMYSLSVRTPDPDGLDLTAVAQQVYLPMQGEN